MSQESKGKFRTRIITWAGSLQVSKNDELKITKGIVYGNGNISAFRLENVTTGRKEKSRNEGVLMSVMPVDFNPPLSGFVQNVEGDEGETTFELVEGIGVLEVKFRKLIELASPFLDKEIVEQCINKEKAEDIITSAFRILEERIRKQIGASYERSGVDLVNDAFNTSTGKLTIGETKSEREGVYHLFRGSMLFFRNPSAHRYVKDYTEFEIFEIVTHVNLLLNILDKCATIV